MKRVMTSRATLAILALAVAAPAAGARARVEDVVVKTWLSRTALWVGDRVTFTVEIACAPNVDVFTEDLAKEKLRVQGLEVVSAEAERETRDDGGVTHRIHYRLVTYDIGSPTARIEELRFRYYVRRAGQRLEDAVPAGEGRVPGAALAWRSTIPDDLQELAVRDVRPAIELSPLLRHAGLIGLALLLISAAPVAVWGASLLRRSWPRRGRRSARDTKQAVRTTLEELRRLDPTTEAERRSAYARLDAAVRRHVADVADVPAQSLTPVEIASRLRANGSRLSPDEVGALLDECERARYGPAAQVPPAERLRDAIAKAEQLMMSARLKGAPYLTR